MKSWLVVILGIVGKWLLDVFTGPRPKSRIRLEVKDEAVIAQERKHAEELKAEIRRLENELKRLPHRSPPRLWLVIGLALSFLIVSLNGCALNNVPPNNDETIMNDLRVLAGEPSPIEGIVVEPGRYTHLLECENKCSEP